MTPAQLTAAQWQAYVDAAAPLLGLPVRAPYRAGVLQYLALAESMMAAVDAVPLPASVEPAVRFEPVSPVTPSEPDARKPA